MNALEILTDMSRVKPYYQAIFSADSHMIIGYEVLARIETEDGVKSLGPFFHDPTVPIEFSLKVDDYVQTTALEYLLQNGEKTLLFINVNVNHILIDQDDDLMSRLITFRQKGLDLSQIVIEVTEHNVMGDMIKVATLCKNLKSMGVKIAIDDVGIGASNLDRIAMLEPDILKVDIHALKNQEHSTSYDGVLYSLALLSRKIGAELLFEAIEDSDQFHYSWNNNGRYYQGYFLAKPHHSFLEKNMFKDRFKKDIYEFILLERKKYQSEYGLSSQLNNQLETLIKGISFDQDSDRWMIKIAEHLASYCMRVYVTDDHGYQISSNAIKNNDSWMLNSDYKGRNWSWRPFFIENLVRMDEESRGILSDIYSDIETGEAVQTFSYRVADSSYLFIDIRVNQ
ncbi:EAL domain-containing protein [Metabacillus litoralis]|uniref:EAL domain-containing protein n=1 Tax=Metabacillus litoralis TaxID=152268 RepID=UPI001CFD6B91|nr:EAL-associated domain-containing protein [Metabacillus litoralis]